MRIAASMENGTWSTATSHDHAKGRRSVGRSLPNRPFLPILNERVDVIEVENPSHPLANRAFHGNEGPTDEIPVVKLANLAVDDCPLLATAGCGRAVF